MGIGNRESGAIVASAVVALLLASFMPLAHADYSQHSQATALLDALRDQYGFNDAELITVRGALADARQLPQLIEREQKAPEKTETWTQYVRRVDSARIEQGAATLRAYPELFARAEAEYGVAPAVIAAIMGIETRYGRITGSARVLDALATQGFDHPTRSKFFFSELTEYFVLCRDLAVDPAQLKGSYAGAMGAAQFMPSNYRRLALDFDGDGARDLWQLPDAIGSIARYLTDYDPARSWQRGEPLRVHATLSHPLPSKVKVNGKRADLSAAQLAALGVQTAVPLPGNTPVGILRLPLDGGGEEVWVGLSNFYAVMTYNPRVFYAMAVAELAEQIERQLTQDAAP